MPNLTWNDLEDIALALSDKYPEQDPAYIRFTDLHKWVTELDNFSDDPKKSNESKLEAIQMAWIDEYQDHP
jgi:FeS assembly protein IscX